MRGLKRLSTILMVAMITILFVGNGIGLASDEINIKSYAEFGLGTVLGVNELLPGIGVKTASVLTWGAARKIKDRLYVTMGQDFYLSDYQRYTMSMELGLGGFLRRSLYMNMGYGFIGASSDDKGLHRFYPYLNVAMRIFTTKKTQYLKSLWLELGFKDNAFCLSLLARLSKTR